VIGLRALMPEPYDSRFSMIRAGARTAERYALLAAAADVQFSEKALARCVAEPCKLREFRCSLMRTHLSGRFNVIGMAGSASSSRTDFRSAAWRQNRQKKLDAFTTDVTVAGGVGRPPSSLLYWGRWH
jgi:hypothetical protein